MRPRLPVVHYLSRRMRAMTEAAEPEPGAEAAAVVESEPAPKPGPAPVLVAAPPPEPEPEPDVEVDVPALEPIEAPEPGDVSPSLTITNPFIPAAACQAVPERYS